jgi:hypothetical protein
MTTDDKLIALMRDARRLDRYAETPGMGLFKSAEGPWLRRADVLALLDGLDVLREETTDNPYLLHGEELERAVARRKAGQ